jgi:hypothetical protein
MQALHLSPGDQAHESLYLAIKVTLQQSRGCLLSADGVPSEIATKATTPSAKTAATLSRSLSTCREGLPSIR